MLVFLWQVLVDNLSEAIVIEGSSSAKIDDRHWSHDYMNTLAQILSPVAQRWGEQHLLRGFDDCSACAQHTADIMSLLLSAEIDVECVADSLSYVVPHTYQPSAMISHSMIFTESMRAILGPVLHRELNRRVLTQWFGLPTQEPLNLMEDVIQDLVGARHTLAHLRSATQKRPQLVLTTP